MTALLSCWKRPARSALQVAAHAQGEDVAEECEQLRVDIIASGSRCSRGPVDDGAVDLGREAIRRADVAAVHRHAHEHLADGFVQLVARVIAKTAVALADLEERRGKAVEVRTQRVAHDEVARLSRDRSRSPGRRR